MRPYTSLGLRARQGSGPKPKRSVTPGLKPSINASALETSSSISATERGSFRSMAIDLRLRSRRSYFRGRLIPSSAGCLRSMRNTVAPRSASSMAHIGEGPTPASSTMRIPASGPMSTLAHGVPLRIGPIVHGAIARAPHALHPAAAVDDDEVAGDITRFVSSEKREQVGEFGVLAEAPQRHAHLLPFDLRSRRIQLFPRAFGGEEARRHRVQANMVRPPFDGETARHGDNAGFGGGGGRGEGGSRERRGRRDAEYRAGAFGIDPAPATGDGAIKRTVQHNAEHGIDGARRQLVGARDEI